ncbi:MAG: hypothetical protein KDD50_14580 [Bdellovibrionales bacterium]|nr:hypothetical protein [Bdellovibrionales bacterium]
MSLHCTPVSKCLDKKTLIWGFEMADLLVIFLMLAILNFLFGQTNHKLFLVWMPPAIVGLVLKYGKKGKPENFLLHWIRFQFKAGVFCAFRFPTNDKLPPSLKRGVA